MQRIAERMPVRAGRIVSKFMTFTLCASSLMACGGGAVPNELQAQVTTMNQDFSPVGMDTITLGAGCFWCVEAVFVELKGVATATSGYMGGHVKDPSYSEVCTGNTGHAEVARLVYDPKVISFDEILEVFWQTHQTATTLNRQGADSGTQYRSAIFWRNPEEQRDIAEAYMKKLNEKPCVPRADRYGDQQGDRVLPSRELPPELLRVERRPRLLPNGHPSETGQVPEGLRG